MTTRLVKEAQTYRDAVQKTFPKRFNAINLVDIQFNFEAGFQCVCELLTREDFTKTDSYKGTVEFPNEWMNKEVEE